MTSINIYICSKFHPILTTDKPSNFYFLLRSLRFDKFVLFMSSGRRNADPFVLAETFSLTEVDKNIAERILVLLAYSH